MHNPRKCNSIIVTIEVMNKDKIILLHVCSCARLLALLSEKATIALLLALFCISHVIHNMHCNILSAATIFYRLLVSYGISLSCPVCFFYNMHVQIYNAEQYTTNNEEQESSKAASPLPLADSELIHLTIFSHVLISSTQYYLRAWILVLFLCFE